MGTAVELRGLTKTYRRFLPWAKGEVRAVRGLSLTIPRGEIFGLLGPNGAGKTTTIKMIAGLIELDAGRISFPAFARDKDQGTRSVRRPRIGAVLEGSRNLYWRLSPWENIRYFGEIKGVPLSTLRRQAGELLELFGLAEKRNRPAQTLSRGMQQKLALILALLGEPELLLLDEPTLGLDVSSSMAIQQLLKQMNRERGLTIVMTTHLMDVAQSLCHRVGIMREGEIVVCEPVADLVDLFKRQDYTVRFDAVHWQALAPSLAAFEFETLAEERPGQLSVRFKLASAREVYPLIEAFGRQQVELHDFHQELPTLEDIFISITETEKGGGGEHRNRPVLPAPDRVKAVLNRRKQSPDRGGGL
ncbi:ABC transporter ATP-binding protein [bacterium]|nr:ABC transporter ATP-binding protein [bacterium]